MVLLTLMAGSVSGQEITTKLTRIQCPDSVETYVCKALYLDISPPLIEMAKANTDVIRIIPNPSKGTFRIDAGKMKFGSLNVIIMDITGRTIMQRACRDKADMLFDLSASPEGSYFVKVSADNQEVTQKLILTH